MKSTSAALVRSLRDAAREELRTSDSQWREYRRRRWSRLFVLIARWTSPLVLFAGAILIPVAFATLMICLGDRAAQAAAAGTGLTFPLALQSLAVTVFLVFLAAGNNRAYFSGCNDINFLLPLNDLRIAAYLPVADRDLKRAAFPGLLLVIWIVAAFLAITLRLLGLDAVGIAGGLVSQERAPPAAVADGGCASAHCACLPHRQERRQRRRLVLLGVRHDADCHAPVWSGHWSALPLGSSSRSLASPSLRDGVNGGVCFRLAWRLRLGMVAVASGWRAALGGCEASGRGVPGRFCHQRIRDRFHAVSGTG